MILNLISQAIRAALAPPGEPDPFFANVTSLLHFDEADGSIAITDEKGVSWTREGSAVVEHASSKFGPGALRLANSTADSSFSGPNGLIAPAGYSADHYTIEGWIKPDNLTGFQYGRHILVAQTGGIGNSDQFFGLFDGKVTYYRGGSFTGGLVEATGTTVVSVGTWNHIAVSYDGTTVRVFLNGSLQASAAAASGWPNINSQPVRIGRNVAPSYASFRMALQGRADEIRITKGVARYTSSFTPPTAPFPDAGAVLPFASLLHFDGANGSTFFYDVAGNAWVRTGTPALSTAQAKFGVSSLEMLSTGTNYIESSSPDFNFGTGDFCIECWYRPDASSNRSIFCFGGGLQPLVYVASNNFAMFYQSSNVITGGTAVAGSWYHVALNRYLGVLNLFINGVRVGQYAGPGSNDPLNPGSIRIGQFNAGNPSGGFYDELRITKGDSVYQNVVSFTAPTAPFPDL